MARPTNGAPRKLPEFLTNEWLGEWFAAHLDEMAEREKADAASEGFTRARRVELDNLDRAVKAIRDYHAASDVDAA